MMNPGSSDEAKANPYVATEVVIDKPIPFGGTLSSDDYRSALYDTIPNRRTLAREIFNTVFLVVVLALAAATGFQDPVFLILFTILFTLTWWLKLARWVSPSYRRRRKQAKRAAENSRETVGYFDNDGIVEVNDRSASRLHWECFTHSLIFPTHITLQVLGSNTRRIYPLRDFYSVEEARAAIELVAEKTFTAANKQAKENQLRQLIFENIQRPRPIGVETFESYSEEVWPFEIDVTKGPRSFELDLMAGQSTTWLAIRTSIALPLVLIGWFLPIWIALAVWGWMRFDGVGGKSLLEYPLEAFLMLGPIVGLSALAMYRTIRAFLGVRETGQHPATFILRPEGMHISHNSLKSWFRWTCVERVLLDAKSAGWVFSDTGQEAKYPKACFTTEDDFEEFKQALTRFSNT